MASRSRERRATRRRDVELVMRVLSATSANGAAAVAPAHADQARALWQECAAWLGLPAVRGLSIGTRSRMGRRTGEVALQVLVERKLPAGEADVEVPARLRVPGTRRAVPTDVQGIGTGGLDRTDRYSVRLRPAPPGAPVRLRGQPPGTFACLLRDAEGGALFLLSNSHVIAAHGYARRGRLVYQPSPSVADGAIAALSRDIPVELSRLGYPNRADAAIAAISDDALVEAEVVKVGRLSGIGPRPAAGDPIAKFGPASGFQTGRVNSPHANVQVIWVDETGRPARAGFADVVRCSRYASPGDSGAAVVTPARRLVGLHFASFEFESYFVPIENVLAEFRRVHGVELDLVTSL